MLEAIEILIFKAENNSSNRERGRDRQRLEAREGKGKAVWWRGTPGRAVGEPSRRWKQLNPHIHRIVTVVQLRRPGSTVRKDLIKLDNWQVANVSLSPNYTRRVKNRSRSIPIMLFWSTNEKRATDRPR
ncbi:hypothetical protein RRG08_043404 [Elysia crispata]|uniref:Uncharacterized protein n=1 Tax=Elysia crispata TaxID=231223 RepID=A0AAE1E4C3_9GAST|nr:hypothetical protein RRG08_043404 [Elysia crispata]